MKLHLNLLFFLSTIMAVAETSLAMRRWLSRDEIFESERGAIVFYSSILPTLDLHDGEKCSQCKRETSVPLSFPPPSSQLLVKLARLASNYDLNKFARQSINVLHLIELTQLRVEEAMFFALQHGT